MARSKTSGRGEGGGEALQEAPPSEGELVVDHAHDPGELDTLQQGLVRVFRQGQDAAGGS
jgi:hypothetical protein